MTCVKDGGKPRLNADNQPYSVDSVWTAKKPQKKCRAGLALPRAEEVEILSPLETGTARG
jgi:hypothetical protein